MFFTQKTLVVGGAMSFYDAWKSVQPKDVPSKAVGDASTGSSKSAGSSLPTLCPMLLRFRVAMFDASPERSTFVASPEPC